MGGGAGGRGFARPDSYNGSYNRTITAELSESLRAPLCGPHLRHVLLHPRARKEHHAGLAAPGH
jgi:hypothetical protein